MFYFLLLAALANNNPAIIINEIAWMGNESSYANEWIELKNNTDEEINLGGWIIEAEDGAPKINIAGEIPAYGFYLLERSKNYTGALENNGEILELRDKAGNLINKVDASSGWPDGDNDTKQTMEKTGLNWQTSQKPDGTPKAENGKPPITAPQSKPHLAAIGEPIAQATIEQTPMSPKSSPYIYLIASSLALFSGAVILLLKKKLFR